MKHIRPPTTAFIIELAEDEKRNLKLLSQREGLTMSAYLRLLLDLEAKALPDIQEESE